MSLSPSANENQTISPALDPEYLTIENAPNEWTAKTLSHVSALNVAYRQLANAKTDIMADTTLTEDARLVRIADLYDKAVAPKVEAVHASIDELDEYVDTIVGAHRAAVAPSVKPAGIALEAEIRTALRSMSATDRMTVVRQAVESGNRDVLAALAGPTFLHGVDSESVANYQTAYVTKHYPDLTLKTDAMRALTTRAAQTKGALKSLYSTVFTTAEQQKLRAAIAVSERANRHLN